MKPSPRSESEKEKAKEIQMLSNMRQISMAMQSAQSDVSGNPKLGFPADAEFNSAAQVKKMLVENGYLKADELVRLQFDKISIGNVAADDPPDTILLQSKSENGRSKITFLKDGSGRIERSGQSPFGQPPPRTPAFLK